MNAQQYLDYKQRQRLQKRLIYWLVFGFFAVLVSTQVFAADEPHPIERFFNLPHE